MDISKLSVVKLKQLQNRIPKELKKRQSQEKQKLRKQLAALAAARGFALEDFAGRDSSGSLKAEKKAKKRKPVAIKYRHPNNSKLTWTGRGRKPLWVVEWLGQGKKIEALAV